MCTTTTGTTWPYSVSMQSSNSTSGQNLLSHILASDLEKSHSNTISVLYHDQVSVGRQWLAPSPWPHRKQIIFIGICRRSWVLQLAFWSDSTSWHWTQSVLFLQGKQMQIEGRHMVREAQMFFIQVWCYYHRFTQTPVFLLKVMGNLRHVKQGTVYNKKS